MFDFFGPDDNNIPQPQEDPEVARLKREEEERLNLQKEKDAERKRAIAAGLRGQRSLLSSGYEGFRKKLGSN